MNRNNTRLSQHVLAALAIGSLLACGGGGGGGNSGGGGGGGTTAKIAYTAPASGTYQLIKNTTKSTDTHLVLDLMGPAGTASRGVAFYLTTDTNKLSWAKVNSSDAEYAISPAFTATAGTYILKGKSSSGTLQVGAMLKGTQGTAVTFDATTVLASVALDLRTGAATGTATLTALSGKAVMLPSTAGADPIAITITPGTVTIQ